MTIEINHFKKVYCGTHKLVTTKQKELLQNT